MLEAIVRSNPRSDFMYVVDTRPKVSPWPQGQWKSFNNVYSVCSGGALFFNAAFCQLGPGARGSSWAWCQLVKLTLNAWLHAVQNMHNMYKNSGNLHPNFNMLKEALLHLVFKSHVSLRISL